VPLQFFAIPLIAASQIATPQDVPPPPPAIIEPAPVQSDADAIEDIFVTARKRNPIDPVEAINVQAFEAVQAVDKAVVGPVARGYADAVPNPARDGLRNVINNLDEPIVVVNYLLQLKPGKAVETLGRFAINSTLGIAGLFDIAKRKPFNLPYRANGLANTLGYYGVGSGPYFYLPLIGPTTLRDVLARPIDLAILPAIAGRPFSHPAFAIGKWAIGSLDERAREDERIKARREENADVYAIVRDEYLAMRRAEIDALHGRRRAEPGTP
jgi:phospholipid-binding lipoprotein MlaA